MHFEVGVSLRDGLGILAAGLLAAAAFPPLGYGPLILPSVVLLLFILRDQKVGDARNLAIVYGFLLGLGTMYWMIGLFGWLAFCLIGLMAAYFGLLGTLVGLTRDQPAWARAVLAAVFALAIEWLRSDCWYLRFPWYTPPHALAGATAWIAPSRWIGSAGLSFAVWFIAGAGVFVRPWYWLAFLLLPACFWLLPGFDPPDRQALLFQGEETDVLEKLMSSTASKHYDLAVLPEYTYFSDYRTALKFPSGPRLICKKTGSPVVFGAIDGTLSSPDMHNVAVVLAADGTVLGTFPKQHPVPLFLDGKPGQDRPVFAIGQETLGIAVCFDFSFQDIPADLVSQGATVLVLPNRDNLEWSRPQHLHHELQARLRAVENDRWILRAASSGRTETIDPHGNPSAEGVEIGAQGTLAVTYGNRHSLPWGGQLHFLGLVAAGLTVLYLIFWIARKWLARRKARQASVAV